MLATHTPKMFNAKIKSPALSARIIGSLSKDYITSQSVSMRREIWAAPSNAADMKKYREKAGRLVDKKNIDVSIPGITDPHLKQILLPLNWENDEYVSVTPVSSMGLSNELYQRLYEMNIPYRQWVVQPTPAAMANHGENIMMQNGIQRMLRRGILRAEKGEWKGSFIQLQARFESMNVSSGMLALGFPSITAIGGYVHTLERLVKCDIEFAIGFKSCQWIHGLERIVVNKDCYGNTTGRLRGKKIKASPGYSTEEIKANGELVLLLRAEKNKQLIIDQIAKVNRIAGGSLFDIEVSEVVDDYPAEASYLFDATRAIKSKIAEEKKDSLQAALEFYSENGEWREGNRYWQSGNGCTLNHTGYAFLEEPANREGTRGNYPHAWAEPIHSLINQGTMSDTCWWKRKQVESGVIWEAGRVK